MTTHPELAFLMPVAPSAGAASGPARVDTARSSVLLVLTCLTTSFVLCFVLPDRPIPVPMHAAITVSGIAALAALETMWLLRQFGSLRSVILATIASAGAGAGALLLCGEPPSTAALWGSLQVAANVALLVCLHRLVESGDIAWREKAIRVALVGSGGVAAAAFGRLTDDDSRGVKLVGRYGEEVSPGLRGDLRQLLCDGRLNQIDAVVLAFEPDQHDLRETWRRALRASVQDVFLFSPDPPGRRKPRLGGLQVEIVAQRPVRGRFALLKRSFDLAVASMLIAIMVPLFMLIVLAILLETRGPILFRQLRVGYNNELFYILKFRSMYATTSDRLAKQQTVAGDKRITRVGRVIRKLSLDELPQLLNVLRGEMSLVGPRPHAPGTSIGGQRVHTLVPDYACRHLVRPGITGLAQVRGQRGGLHDRRQVSERVRSDLEYIERWSLWLDLRILLGTVLLELRDKRGV